MNPAKKEPSEQSPLREQPVPKESDTDESECDDQNPQSKPVEECCRNKCLMRFDDGFKSRLKSDLSALERTEKQFYLFAMLSINQEVMGRTPSAMKSSKYFQYTVKEYGVSRSVCKTAFIALHDTTPNMVRSLCQKLSTGQLIPTDKRGKHEKHSSIPEHMKELILSHFSDSLQSPVIFKGNKKRYGDPNIYQLWLDFKKKHGYLARSTYSKYFRILITPEDLEERMQNVLHNQNKF